MIRNEFVMQGRKEGNNNKRIKDDDWLGKEAQNRVECEYSNNEGVVHIKIIKEMRNRER